ncbi:MAG: ATP-binding cassette domain-containing protein, partial [Planctomycetota bacterium]|nr:ATP-binding cassette domain-containing protein [Planctomycetota bacterium]
MNPVIRLNGVSKRFGNVQALDDVTLQIPPGTVCAVLGANGAGKSTGIRLLLGFESPDRGDIEVLQMNPKTHALEIRSRVG